MTRTLVPTSVYLSPEHKAEADRRAAEMDLATATLLRLIIVGHSPPLSANVKP